MADKKSGVYYYLTDNSIRPGGGSGFGGVVLMFTPKGDVGKLITVTSQNYQELLGYDLDYNENFLALDVMLAQVTKLNVIRLNKESKVNWLAWNGTGGGAPVTSSLTYDKASDIPLVSPNYSVWAAHKYPGDWGTFGVRFSLSGKETTNVIDQEYLLEYAENSGSSWGSPLNSYVFSLNPTAQNYYFNGDFGDVVFGFSDDFLSVSTNFKTFVKAFGTNFLKLVNGSAGTQVFESDDVLGVKSLLNKLPCDTVLVNARAISDSSVLKAVMDVCASQDRSFFIDVPDAGHNDDGSLNALDTISWVESAGFLGDTGKYGQLLAGINLVKHGAFTLQTPPSAYLFEAYAKMYANTGTTNYPPAGYTTGSVSASQLMDSDFGVFGDDLKTARVNYITSGSRGVCIWEQRTLYNLGGSDLSYANTVFILRDLKLRIMDFMDQFTFRYTTPMQLLNIQSGLTTILNDMTTNNFLVNYQLNVPSYADAQAAGRELNIDIKVSVISGAEVINIRVGLENAANLTA